MAKRSYSEISDSVAQRVLAEMYANNLDVFLDSQIARINFNRFLGFETIFTDANVFDGAFFQMLFEKNDWTRKLKRFGPKRRREEQLLVAGRGSTMEGSLVQAICGKGPMLSGFAMSLIADDAERLRFSKFCRTRSVSSVTDLRSALKLLDDAKAGGEIEQATARRLKRHWRKCCTSPSIEVTPQNAGDKDFSIHRGFDRVAGSTWSHLSDPRKWETISGRPKMSEPALEYHSKVIIEKFDRSRGDAIYHLICKDFKQVDIDLLTLHELFLRRGYNSEIAYCNGAAIDESASLYTHPLNERDRIYDDVALEEKGVGRRRKVEFPPQTFNVLMEIDQLALNSILEKTRYRDWYNAGDDGALQRSLDALGNIKGYRKPLRFVLRPITVVAIPTRRAALWVLSHAPIPPPLSTVLAWAAGRVAARVTRSVAKKGLAMLYSLEGLKRDMISSRRRLDDNLPD